MNVEKVFAETIGSGKTFTDASFPPDESSLYWPNEASGTKEALKEKVDHWARPKGLVEGSSVGPDLYGAYGIVPVTNKEGPIRDDWVLAAAAALAEKPEYIRDVIVNDAYSKEGIFQFQFYVKGELIKVVIDDLLPVGAGGSPANARSGGDGSMWLPLLEKAFAKLYVSYSKLANGNPAEALRVMTGKPVLTLLTSD